MRAMRGAQTLSSSSRVMRRRKWAGCFVYGSSIKKGRLISVTLLDDSSIFAFSAASLMRDMALRSLRGSVPLRTMSSTI